MKLGVHEDDSVVYRKPCRLWKARFRYRWRMRWSDLFDDLEAQVTHAEREAFEEEVRARADSERAAVTLGAVLAASTGASVRVTLIDGSSLTGEVIDSVAQWIHLAAAPVEWLVPAWAISALDGVATGAAEPGAVATRLTFGHALRAVAEDGGEVLVRTQGLQSRGRIAAVGADYLVLEPGRVVPFAAILTVVPAP